VYIGNIIKNFDYIVKCQKAAPDVNKYTESLRVCVFVDQESLSEYTQIIYRLQITHHHGS